MMERNPGFNGMDVLRERIGDSQMPALVAFIVAGSVLLYGVYAVSI